MSEATGSIQQPSALRMNHVLLLAFHCVLCPRLCPGHETGAAVSKRHIDAAHMSMISHPQPAVSQKCQELHLFSTCHHPQLEKDLYWQASLADVRLLVTGVRGLCRMMMFCLRKL